MEMEYQDRILIVAPSETQAVTLQGLCEREGWKASWAATAAAALREFRQEPPALVVTGDFLPEMRRRDLCRLIRNGEGTADVPTLIWGTCSEAEKRPLHSDAGTGIHTLQDADSAALAASMRSLLEDRRLPRQSAQDGDFHSARLLAIDDSPTHLEYLSMQLRQEGYRVEQASSGEEGLGLLARQSFDCVLVDLMMPGMDGIEVCQRINQMRQHRRDAIGVIILTAQEARHDLMRGLEAGADDFVGKSSDLAVLRARIQALLRRKSFEEEHRRVREKLKASEMDAMRAMADKEVAEARAALAERLAQTNQELEETNRKLKHTQAHLIQQEKMASLGRLVAGIAHEINNPLSFVLNNLFTVESSLRVIAPEAAPHVSPAARQKLGKIRTRLEHMREGLDRVKELVHNLRTFSRLDEGEFQTVDIHESIDSALRFLQHRIQGRIQLEKHYGLSRSLDCYAGQINQVFLNLIANAVDSIENTGKIVITTGERDGQTFISIRDDGVGIPESIRNRIFEPFFTTKPIGQGTGLGLALSYGIINAHHGTLDMFSEKGQGTEFIVRIPLNLKTPTTHDF